MQSDSAIVPSILGDEQRALSVATFRPSVGQLWPKALHTARRPYVRGLIRLCKFGLPCRVCYRRNAHLVLLFASFNDSSLADSLRSLGPARENLFCKRETALNLVFSNLSGNFFSDRSIRLTTFQFFGPEKKGTKIAYSKIHAFNGTNFAYSFCPSF